MISCHLLPAKQWNYSNTHKCTHSRTHTILFLHHLRLFMAKRLLLLLYVLSIFFSCAFVVATIVNMSFIDLYTIYFSSSVKITYTVIIQCDWSLALLILFSFLLPSIRISKVFSSNFYEMGETKKNKSFHKMTKK